MYWSIPGSCCSTWFRAAGTSMPSGSDCPSGVSVTRVNNAGLSKETGMTLPKIVSHDEWLQARKALLDKEKELTRTRDALNIERRNLPMVEVTKDYEFDSPDGKVRLLDLFED